MTTTTNIHSGLLRLALRLDAAASGAMGLGLAATSTVADSVLGVPAGWLVGIGLGLVAWAVLLAVIARGPAPSGAVWSVVAGNAAWVVASVATVVAGWFPLTGLGIAFVILQAAAVVVLLELQYVGLRRMRPLAHPSAS
jgi:hypothetical protein